MNLSRNLARTAAAIGTIAALVIAPAALAVPIGTVHSYALDVAESKSGLPGTSYGMVTLTQGLNEVDVNVTLADGFLFANTGVGAQFAFNLTQPFANAAVTLDAGTAVNFVLAPGSGYNVTPYGVFTDALLFKDGIPGGLSARIGGPLNFSVAQTGISLDAFSLSSARNDGQPGGYSFAADLGFAATGKTGGVAAVDYDGTTTPTSVPEPMSLALLGLGLGGLALSRRK